MVIYAQVIHQTILYLIKIYFLSMANLPNFKKNKTTKGGIAYKTFKY